MFDRLKEIRKESDTKKEGIQVYYFERHSTPWYKLSETVKDFYRALGEVRRKTLEEVRRKERERNK